MSIVLDTNMKLFAERMDITSSRMIQDYGLKTVDEIIEAEAERGNTKAINYAREMYNSSAKLIKVFKLTDIENKFNILHKMDDKTRRLMLPLLDSEDLVMGLYFFTQEKLLEMLMETNIEELVNVIMHTFTLPQVIMMFTEDDLAQFFLRDELEQQVITEQLKSMPPEVMIKFVEGITGRPSDETNPFELINSIDRLPEDKYKKFVSSIDPDVQRQLVLQLVKVDSENLQLFENQAYVNMLSTLMKPEMVKPMINLNKDSLVNMISILPDDLMAIVGAQVDTLLFANFLLDDRLEILENALMI